MTTKSVLIAATVIALAGISLYINRDWFSHEDIQISHRAIRPGPARRGRAAAPAESVQFVLDRKLQLTAIRVFPLAALETNKYARPIWQMISDSNSPPLIAFNYGMRVEGMRPYIKEAVADALIPGAKYRLALEAGKTKAQHDFVFTPPSE
jgi:hypothetical protein